VISLKRWLHLREAAAKEEENLRRENIRKRENLRRRKLEDADPDDKFMNSVKFY